MRRGAIPNTDYSPLQQHDPNLDIPTAVPSKAYRERWHPDNMFRTDLSRPITVASMNTQSALPVAQQDTGNAGGFQDYGAGTQTSAPAPAPAPGPSPQATTQSAPQDTRPKYQLDARPYAYLAEQRPQDRAYIDQVAEQTGVSPVRLAVHWNNESRGAYTSPDGKAGELGPLQIMPATWTSVDPKHQLDPRNWKDALVLAGRINHRNDAEFGKDTVSSVGAYQGGSGSPNSIYANKDNPEIENLHPNTMSYVRNSFANPRISAGDFTPSSSMTPQGVMAAASQGPDGFIRYVAQNKAPGSGMTDAWRQAESSLVRAMALRGDYNGITHAHDMIFQMSHVGTNQYLMAAHQALESGDTNGAAQALAKAHAFFPDETMGRFSVNKDGTLWGERLDEHNPGKVIGQPFQITSQGIASMLNQTSDPQQYLKMVMEQQKSAAYNRHLDSLGQYYTDQIHSREKIADENNRTKVETAEIRGPDTQMIRNAGRLGLGPGASHSAAVDKEANTLYNRDVMPAATPEQLGTMGETYHELRTMGGISGPQAQNVTDGLAHDRLGLTPLPDGSFGVVNPKQPGQPIAILSHALVARLYPKAAQAVQAGPQPGAPNNPAPNTPVGAGAPSAVTRASGIGQNMTGYTTPTSQSAALPPR